MNINLTLLMQAAAFAAFIWFTARFIWPPLMRAVDTRQKQIADGLAAGEQGRKELASAEKRIADMLTDAKSKAAEIVATGEKFRSETMDAAKTEAKAEADRMIAAAKASLMLVTAGTACRGRVWERRASIHSSAASRFLNQAIASRRRAARSIRSLLRIQ